MNDKLAKYVHLEDIVSPGTPCLSGQSVLKLHCEQLSDFYVNPRRDDFELTSRQKALKK